MTAAQITTHDDVDALHRDITEIRATPEDSPIQTLADVKGKPIGISSPTASNVVQFRAVLGLAGIDPETDVVWRAVGLARLISRPC